MTFSLLFFNIVYYYTMYCDQLLSSELIYIALNMYKSHLLLVPYHIFVAQCTTHVCRTVLYI